LSDKLDHQITKGKKMEVMLDFFDLVGHGQTQPVQH
jgi:hypothetical protein